MNIYTSNIRVSSRTFTDTHRFPYGFKKSGDFSVSEANILSIYGNTLFNLEIGRLLASTQEEEQFIKCSKGLANAESAIEKAWMKYVKLARSKRHFYTMHSCRVREIESSYDDDQNYSENYIDFDDNAIES